MKLGISGQALGDVMSFQEIVRIGKKYGIRNYEIWPCNVGTIYDYAEADPEQIKKIMKEEAVQVDCVTMRSIRAAPDMSPEKYAERLMAAMDFAKEIGAKIVNHYCNKISTSDIPDWKRMEQYWSAPLKHAEDIRMPLALENEAHDSTCSPENMAAIMKHFDSPLFRTNYDVTNYFHASCEGYPAGYEILKPYIGYVHLKNGCLYRPDSGQPEAYRGAAMTGIHAPAVIQYAPLPDGAVNIAGLLTRLQEDGIYNGLCTLEPHTAVECVEECYSRETKWLRSLGFFKD